jgi:hypothetical protein
MKCKEMKIGSNMVDSSKESYGSERAAVPKMMVKYK